MDAEEKEADTQSAVRQLQDLIKQRTSQRTGIPVGEIELLSENRPGILRRQQEQRQERAIDIARVGLNPPDTDATLLQRARVVVRRARVLRTDAERLAVINEQPPAVAAKAKELLDRFVTSQRVKRARERKEREAAEAAAPPPDAEPISEEVLNRTEPKRIALARELKELDRGDIWFLYKKLLAADKFSGAHANLWWVKKAGKEKASTEAMIAAFQSVPEDAAELLRAEPRVQKKKRRRKI